MPKKTAVKKIKNPPSPKKVLSLLASEGVTKQKVCKVISEGLEAVKPIVSDGEIISYEPDFNVRHKYIETILDVIGEKKLVMPEGDLHVHFTSILQQIRAYANGDVRAERAAGRFIESIESVGGNPQPDIDMEE